MKRIISSIFLTVLFSGLLFAEDLWKQQVDQLNKELRKRSLNHTILSPLMTC